jgi:ATP-dependent DNA ligase
LMLFDCLAVDGGDLAARPLEQRRAALERFHAGARRPDLLLSPASPSIEDARAWLANSGGALDGVVAKRLDEPYRHGERAMLKVKQHRTADCVVGGFRRVKGKREVASLLLGLFNDQGRLDHVGFCSGIAEADRGALTDRLEPLIEAPGFNGKAPGGPSRWNDGRESEWEPLRPDLVVEVLYDQVTARRFRHGTRILRWRPDKDAARCTMDQLIYALRPTELEGIL